MLIRRKEAKDYGTKKLIEGRFEQGEKCLIIEDVVTSGTSVMETVDALKSVGVVVTDAVVLLDREQGGADRLSSQGIKLHSVCTLTKVLDILQKADKLSAEMVKKVQTFISENKFEPITVNKRAVSDDTRNSSESNKRNKKCLKYSERQDLCYNVNGKKLFAIMEAKKTNLAFSADLTYSQTLLDMVDCIGPHVCMVKTHVDILDDFTPQFTEQLKKLASKHNFMIFEDRKFADIGHTVKHQYSGGVHRISGWADITNAHIVPGDGVIKGLKEVGIKEGKSCVLIAEMSSEGNLATGDYTKACLKMGEEHRDFVIGYICQSRLSTDPAFIHMTPGVQLKEGIDALGQKYLTPHEVIANKHSDVIIVGRGIYSAEDPLAAAKMYQEAGYKAYESQFD
ncbi:uridine 5'-monophosphate synthase-like isoform X2 [Gigantopelta aegis]|nr:uridine 5'-monophosphate synthase-like isoform X2 [Gigantopelta aegis]